MREPKSQSSPDDERLLEWVERVATFFGEHYGLPPITGRVLGWLLICATPEQSAGEIAEAIGASRASLTTTMRFLVGSGLVERFTRPRGRTTYYRIDDDMWEEVVRRRIASMTSFTRLTEEGMRLVGAGRPRAARLRAAHDFFAWMRDLFGASAARPKPRG
jgi:DNA-binding transcriptional ArsR family regulator